MRDRRVMVPLLAVIASAALAMRLPDVIRRSVGLS